ncbi:hypothetical protein RhiirA5_447009 [Rhizophagus irregularis]|uniref:FAR1 domain-containing protein n=1 Tax=Rhizophagus irregularis TaxID=588596 RepID=A0A2N0NBH7_9GLOM|nr:hypothetical protein RhiirA5_447009 [Rhizophagus irregularis]
MIEKGDTFEDWKSAEKQVEIYLKVVGFGVIKRHLEKNSYGEYCAKKRADVEETHKRDSVKIKCSWKVNLNYNKGIIRITSIHKEHNHLLYGNGNKNRNPLTYNKGHHRKLAFTNSFYLTFFLNSIG